MLKSHVSFLIVLTGLLFNMSSYGQINAYDGFESDTLSKIWSTSRMTDKSIEFQSDFVRNGNKAIKITVRSDDKFEAGDLKNLSTERDELLMKPFYSPYEGKEYEYKFSMFFPLDFPVVNTRLVIAQWKQFCPLGDSCSENSPVIAIRYVGGELYVTCQTDSGSKKLYKQTAEIRNKWLDFTFKIRFSRHNNGGIEATLNDKEIINYKGINCYSEARGYPPKSRYYFKMGLYRDLMKEPMTIYIDEFSLKELRD